MTDDDTTTNTDSEADVADAGTDTASPDEPEGATTTQVDAVELVGPGKYPLRIQPASAIMPGTADARRLLRIWFVRKSFYWLFFSGIIAVSVVAATRHENPEFDVQDGSASLWLIGLFALALRFVTNWVALGLAYPLALAHEPSLSPRTNFGSGIGLFFDRMHVARAFRALRWTHHVRQVAQHRLGRRGEQLGKLDPIFDIVNITTGVLAFIALIAAASRTQV